MTTARRTFTLIEMLVVVAVIGILSSLLLPALGKSRATGIKIVCANNLKQIHTGVMLYVDDYGGWMPYAHVNGNQYQEINNYLNQPYDLSGFILKRPAGILYCPTAPYPADRSPCWTGGVPTAYYLPNYKATCNTSYTTTSGPKEGGWLLNDMTPGSYRRADFIPNSSAIVGETNYHANTGPFVTSCLLYGGAWSTQFPLSNSFGPAWNHLGSANFLFQDGHVSAFKYTGTSLFDSHWLQK